MSPFARQTAPGINTGDVNNRKRQLPMENGVKTQLLLPGFTDIEFRDSSLEQVGLPFLIGNLASPQSRPQPA